MEAPSMANSASTKRRVNWYLVLVVLITAIGPLQFGFHLAALNAPQDVLTCKRKSLAVGLDPDLPPSSLSSGDLMEGLPDCIPMSEVAFATISSIFTAGGLVGALGAGPIATRTGRLPTMRLTTLCFLAGSSIMTAAANVSFMAIGRFVVGLGAGASTVVVPMYISEVAPPQKRGLFGFATQLMVNLGIVFTQTLGYFLSRSFVWRWIMATGSVISLVYFSSLVVVPESPTWLQTKGKVEEAREVMKRMGAGETIPGHGVITSSLGDDGPSEEDGLLSPVADTDISPSAEQTGVPAKYRKKTVGFLGVIKDPLYRPAAIACMGIMVAQQFCGVNSIIMYSVSLMSNMLPINSALLTIIVSLCNLVMTGVCAPLPDRLGRKTCLLYSIYGQGSSALVLALSIVFGVRVLSAISVMFFVVFFAVGLGPVPFMMASELVGPEAVDAIQSWCLSANYVSTFLVAQFFPIINTQLNKALGRAGWVYFLFASFALLSALFIWRFVPETKGKKDADEVWGRTRRVD